MQGENTTIPNLKNYEHIGIPKATILAQEHIAATAHGLGHLPLPILSAHLEKKYFRPQGQHLVVCHHDL